MYKDKCVDLSLGYQIRGDHRFAEAGGCRQYARIMFKYSVGCFLLFITKLTVE